MYGSRRIQRGTMAGKISRYRGAGHAPGKVGRGAECLLVEEVAPSSDGLCQGNIYESKVDERGKGDLSDLAHDVKTNRGTDDASVDGKSARSRIDYPRKVFGIVSPVEYDKVQSGTDNTAGNGHQDEIVYKARRHFKFLGVLDCKEYREQHGCGNEYSVPVNLKISDPESDRRNIYIDPQSRELDFGVVHLSSP